MNLEQKEILDDLMVMGNESRTSCTFCEKPGHATINCWQNLDSPSFRRRVQGVKKRGFRARGNGPYYNDNDRNYQQLSTFNNQGFSNNMQLKQLLVLHQLPGPTAMPAITNPV